MLDDESVRRETAVWADFADSDEHFYFVVCHGQTVIGYIALHKRENGYETGYCFHSDYQGKGYAKESMRAVLDYMKAQGVTRIEAHTALKNAPSVKLLTSLGFIRTGTEEISFLRDQEGKDIIIEDGIFEMQLS